jgi:tetratricopeptide (TPR) repeat protein
MQGPVKPGVPDPVMDSLELTNPAHIAERGTSALRMGNLPLAVRAFRQAVQLDPADVEIRLRLAVALARSGDVQGALDQYEEASRLAPENAQIPYNVGTLLARQKRHEEAVEHLARAVELNPDHQHAQFNLGQTLRQLERYEDSLTHLERSIDLDPRHQTARLWLFKVLMQLGRYEEALQWLEGHFAIYPEDPVGRHALARFLAVCPADTVRDGDRAVELALSVVAEQDTPEYRRTVAMSLAEAGRFAEAAQWQSETVERVKGQVPATSLETMQAELRLYRRGSPVRLSDW